MSSSTSRPDEQPPKRPQQRSIIRREVEPALRSALRQHFDRLVESSRYDSPAEQRAKAQRAKHSTELGAAHTPPTRSLTAYLKSLDPDHQRTALDPFIAEWKLAGVIKLAQAMIETAPDIALDVLPALGISAAAQYRDVLIENLTEALAADDREVREAARAALSLVPDKRGARALSELANRLCSGSPSRRDTLEALHHRQVASYIIDALEKRAS